MKVLGWYDYYQFRYNFNSTIKGTADTLLRRLLLLLAQLAFVEGILCSLFRNYQQNDNYLFPRENLHIWTNLLMTRSKRLERETRYVNTHKFPPMLFFKQKGMTKTLDKLKFTCRSASTDMIDFSNVKSNNLNKCINSYFLIL